MCCPRSERQELLEYLLKRYYSDALLLEQIGRLLGLSGDEVRKLLSFFEKGSITEQPQTCVKLLNALLRRFDIRPTVIIRGDISRGADNVTCIISREEGESLDGSLATLFGDVKHAFVELFNTLSIILPKSYKSEEGSLGIWRFRNLENYLVNVRKYIKDKVSETVSKGYIVLDDPSFSTALKEIGPLCKDKALILRPEMIKDGVLYDSLESLVNRANPYLRCQIAPDIDRKILVELIFSILFDMVVAELQKGYMIEVSKKLKLLSSIMGVQEIMGVKPLIEAMEREIKNSKFDFIKALEESMTVEKDLPKKIAKEEFITKFLQHQTAGKKPFNDLSLSIYLLLHIVVSQILLYRVVYDPENMNGYFVTYYKHLTEVLHNVLNGLQLQVRKGLNHISFDPGIMVDGLKMIRDNVTNYPDLIKAIAKYVNASIATLLGGAIEGENPLLIDIGRKDDKEPIINLVVSGSKGKFFFTMSLRPYELISLILELKVENLRRGLIVSSNIKEARDRDKLWNYVLSFNNSLKQKLPISTNPNLMLIEEGCWWLS